MRRIASILNTAVCVTKHCPSKRIPHKTCHHRQNKQKGKMSPKGVEDKMNLGSKLKSIFIYKEPQAYNQFEFLEDEPEDNGEIGFTQKGEAGDDAQVNSADTSAESAQNTSKKKRKDKPQVKVEDLLKEKPAKESQQKQNTQSKVSRNLKDNLDKIKLEFSAPTNQDVVIREFKVLQQSNAFLVYIDGLAEKDTVNNFTLRQLLERNNVEIEIKTDMVEYIADNLLAVNQIKKESDYIQIVHQVLNGLTALFVDGSAQCILIESRGYEKRSVSTPLNETVVKGPQEAFIENLRTNITLVRRIVRNKNLVTEMLPVGKTNHLTCGLLYMKGLTNPRIVAEVKRRINSVDIDFISTNGALDQLIEDHPHALFPQILSTERPDRTASFLMEGKVALICDGTPYASIVPVTFFHMLQTSEDYSLRWQGGTFLRIVRVMACILAIFLPGIYLALTSFHHEMIPTELLISLTKAKEIVPFPAIIEMLLVEVSWELIREAGVRVPGVVGQTLGIIGGVILGQAAVSAGLVDPILIIIVAITGLGNFAIPIFGLSFGIRTMRFVFILLGGLAGFYGIAAGIFAFGGLACSMKSFGVPFFSPVAPKTQSTADLVVRLPTWMQTERPDAMNTKDRQRAGKVVRGWTQQSRKGDSRNDQGR